jgi:hypothetical protein
MEAESPMKFMGMVARRAARRAARPKTGSVNQPTTGGPQKGIVSTTPLPGGDKEGVKRTGGRRGLLGGLARGVKSVGKAVKGAVGGGMSGIAKAKSAAKGGGMSGIAKAKSAVKNVGGLAKGVSLGGAVNAVKQKVIKK